MLLSGCTVLLINEDTSVKNTIYNFSLALSDQNWSKAKSYCIYESSAYYKIGVLEGVISLLHLTYFDVVTFTYSADIISVNVYGTYAEAYAHLTVVLTYGVYTESEIGYRRMYLQKVGSSWKLYDWGS